MQLKVQKLLWIKKQEDQKGFAFVEMEDTTSGNAAIEALNGKETEGRTLRVNEAKPKEDRPRDSRPRRNF